MKRGTVLTLMCEGEGDARPHEYEYTYTGGGIGARKRCPEHAAEAKARQTAAANARTAAVTSATFTTARYGPANDGLPDYQQSLGGIAHRYKDAARAGAKLLNTLAEDIERNIAEFIDWGDKHPNTPWPYRDPFESDYIYEDEVVTDAPGFRVTLKRYGLSVLSPTGRLWRNFSKAGWNLVAPGKSVTPRNTGTGWDHTDAGNDAATAREEDNRPLVNAEEPIRGNESRDEVRSLVSPQEALDDRDRLRMDDPVPVVEAESLPASTE